MSHYIGEECIVCKKKFEESDDVVVCPECGTPYHRECYKSAKGCINYALHETGGSWMAEHLEKLHDEQSIKKVCPKCAYLNNKNAEECEMCHTDLNDKNCINFDISDSKVVKINLDDPEKYFGMDPTEPMDEENKITLGEIADYVRENQLYYMAMFKRLKDSTIKITVNLSAFLFPYYYAASRKMYGMAVIMFIIGFILDIPEAASLIAENGFAGSEISEKILTLPITGIAFTNVAKCLDIAVRIVFGLTANSVYLKHITGKLKKLKEQYPNYIKFRLKSKEQGGLSISAILISMLIDALAFFIFYISLVIFVK